MIEDEVKKRLAYLAREIKAADALYYLDDNPALTDAEYDAVSYTHLTLPTKRIV